MLISEQEETKNAPLNITKAKGSVTYPEPTLNMKRKQTNKRNRRPRETAGPKAPTRGAHPHQ